MGDLLSKIQKGAAIRISKDDIPTAREGSKNEKEIEIFNDRTPIIRLLNQAPSVTKLDDVKDHISKIGELDESFNQERISLNKISQSMTINGIQDTFTALNNHQQAVAAYLNKVIRIQDEDVVHLVEKDLKDYKQHLDNLNTLSKQKLLNKETKIEEIIHMREKLDRAKKSYEYMSPEKLKTQKDIIDEINNLDTSLSSFLVDLNVEKASTAQIDPQEENYDKVAAEVLPDGSSTTMMAVIEKDRFELKNLSSEIQSLFGKPHELKEFIETFKEWHKNTNKNQTKQVIKLLDSRLEQIPLSAEELPKFIKEIEFTIKEECNPRDLESIRAKFGLLMSFDPDKLPEFIQEIFVFLQNKDEKFKKEFSKMVDKALAQEINSTQHPYQEGVNAKTAIQIDTEKVKKLTKLAFTTLKELGKTQEVENMNKALLARYLFLILKPDAVMQKDGDLATIANAKIPGFNPDHCSAIIDVLGDADFTDQNLRKANNTVVLQANKKSQQTKAPPPSVQKIETGLGQQGYIISSETSNEEAKTSEKAEVELIDESDIEEGINLQEDILILKKLLKEKNYGELEQQANMLKNFIISDGQKAIYVEEIEALGELASAANAVNSGNMDLQDKCDELFTKLEQIIKAKDPAPSEASQAIEINFKDPDVVVAKLQELINPADLTPAQEFIEQFIAENMTDTDRERVRSALHSEIINQIVANSDDPQLITKFAEELGYFLWTVNTGNSIEFMEESSGYKAFAEIINDVENPTQEQESK